MSRKYKFHNPEGVYFISFAVQGWVDVFTRNEYNNIIIDNLSYCQKNKGLELFAWCLMTNHIHLLATPSTKDGITRMMQYIGRYYVPYINHTYGTSGTLWEGRYKSSLIQSEHYY